jgi:DNA-nicking Smr family endonuclease
VGLNAPFADLAQRLRGVRAAPRGVARGVPTSPPTPPASAVTDDPALFTRAMEGVVPLPDRAGGRVDRPAPAATPRAPVSEEAEALAALSDLVTGASCLDVSDTREYVEGAIVGLDPRVLRRLRRGDFSWQAYEDLHGMSQPQAREAVERFLSTAVRRGHRCVLIVHGRGRNSKDQTPVLKERLKVWLARGRLAGIVLAFATARSCDGGPGALYVLLRRRRRRQPFRVTEGAKR